MAQSTAVLCSNSTDVRLCETPYSIKHQYNTRFVVWDSRYEVKSWQGNR